jgi:hypothetical protein
MAHEQDANHLTETLRPRMTASVKPAS